MMKKLLLVAILALFSFNQSYAQGDLKLGIHGGVPVGDIDDTSNFQISADVAYLFNFMGLLEAGPLVGYMHFFAEDGFDDVQYLPVAASGRLGLPQSFFAGLDLGYAIAVDDNSEGGFYFRPQIGYTFLNFGLVFSYSGISDDNIDIGSLNLGVELKF